MPLELSEADEKRWKEYQAIGTPEQIRTKRNDLERDNANYREKLRDKDKELETAQSDLKEARKTVPEGGKVLDADQAKAWEKYEGLGKPEDLKGRLEKADELEGEAERREKVERAAEAAATLGWNGKVLMDLRGADELDFKTETEKDGDKAVEVGYVIPPEKGATPVKLKDYVEKHWASHIPALEAQGEESDEKPTGGSKPFPRQAAKGTSSKGSVETPEQAVERKKASRRYASPL